VVRRVTASILHEAQVRRLELVHEAWRRGIRRAAVGVLVHGRERRGPAPRRVQIGARAHQTCLSHDRVHRDVVLDLTDSTAIAARIGNIHALLAETFNCLSRVVTDMGGEVYRYVGDELIASWGRSPHPRITPVQFSACSSAARRWREFGRSFCAGKEWRWTSGQGCMLERTSLPHDAVVTSIGSHLLHGKMERVELYAVERRTAAPKTATRFG
jgi:class 3 adenylate cyclase